MSWVVAIRNRNRSNKKVRFKHHIFVYINVSQHGVCVGILEKDERFNVFFFFVY